MVEAMAYGNLSRLRLIFRGPKVPYRSNVTFLDLPAEIRVMIYGHCLQEISNLRLPWLPQDDTAGFHFLMPDSTSQQMWAQTLESLMGVNETIRHEISLQIRSTLSIQLRYHNSYFGSVQNPTDSRQQVFPAILEPLIASLDIDFEYWPNEKEISQKVFVILTRFPNLTQVTLHRVLFCANATRPVNDWTPVFMRMLKLVTTRCLQLDRVFMGPFFRESYHRGEFTDVRFAIATEEKRPEVRLFCDLEWRLFC